MSNMINNSLFEGMTVVPVEKNTVAVIWDFDKTLGSGYMQEPIFRYYGVNATEFWKEVNGLLEEYQKIGRA